MFETEIEETRIYVIIPAGIIKNIGWERRVAFIGKM
jgi:hypothetical protein